MYDSQKLSGVDQDTQAGRPDNWTLGEAEEDEKPGCSCLKRGAFCFLASQDLKTQRYGFSCFLSMYIYIEVIGEIGVNTIQEIPNGPNPILLESESSDPRWCSADPTRLPLELGWFCCPKAVIWRWIYLCMHIHVPRDQKSRETKST